MQVRSYDADPDGTPNVSAWSASVSETPAAPLPLDAYADDIAAAWTTRRLAAPVTAPTLGLRRSADGATSDVTIPANVFDARDAAVQALVAFADGGQAFASAWHDPLGADATQATEGSQPIATQTTGLLMRSPRSLRPAIQFTGTRDLPTGVATFGTTQLDPAPAEAFTILATFARYGDGGGTVAGKATSSANGTQLTMFSGGANIRLRGSSTDLVTPIAEDEIYTVAIRWDGTSATGYVNDAGPIALAVGASAAAAATLILGARIASGNTPARMYLHELVILDAALPPAELSALVASTRDYYDQTVGLDVAAAEATAGMDGTPVLFADDGGDYEAWPWANAFYDAVRGKIVVLYTSGPGHLAPDKEVYVRFMDPADDSISARVLVSTENGATVHGACLLPNGDYLAVVRTGTSGFSYSRHRSTDGGATWVNEGANVDGSGNGIGVELGPVVTSTGTVLGYDRDTATDEAFIVRSTDSGATWTRIPIPGRSLYTLEGSILCLPGANPDGSGGEAIIVYARPQITGTAFVSRSLFAVSYDDGLTWSQMDVGPTAPDSSANPCALLYHADAEGGPIVEGFFGSRRDFGDGFGSIFHAVATPASAQVGQWVEIARVQTMQASDNDSGYPAAVRVGDSVYLFWYDGTDTDTDIYYVKGARP